MAGIEKNWQPGSLYSLPEQEILSSVVDTIIPEGNGIGALSLGVDDFSGSGSLPSVMIARCSQMSGNY